MELRNGRFFHDNKPFASVGFNYLPSNGVYCWRDFNIKEWEEDFKIMSARRFNTIRIFLIWEEFQPAEDRVDEETLAKLQAVCRAAARHSLWVMPTLFNGWMSGKNFDPPWRKGRNHVADLSLRKAMVFSARKVAESLKDETNIFAVDLANEIDVICRDASVDENSQASWTEELANAVRSGRPGTLVTVGLASTTFWADSPWTFAAQRVDFLTVHGYAMFPNAINCSRMGDPRSTIIFGYKTAFANAYGPVMQEEFGTALAGDSALMGGFIRSFLAASYLAGANGFSYYSWLDFTTTAEPYGTHPFESILGCLTAERAPKELLAGYEAFKDFFLDHADYAPAPAEVGLYIPNEYKKKGGERAEWSLPYAYENLIGNGVSPCFSRRISNAFPLIVIPYGALLHIAEIKEIEAYVRGGGRIILVGVSSFGWCRELELLTHARQVDLWRPLKPYDFNWNGVSLTLPPPGWFHMPVLDPLSAQAQVHGAIGDIPVVLRTEYGKGRVVLCVVPLETLLTEGFNLELVKVWQGLLELSGYQRPCAISSPYVQAGVIRNNAGKRKILAINHKSEPLSVRIQVFGQVWDINLQGKDFAARDFAKETKTP